MTSEGKDPERRDEDEKQRVDRELMELLQELRVALPGVQVLFAFLLTIPFAQGFVKLTSVERAVYFGALLFSAAATALLIAPTSYHRLHFRAAEKKQILFTSNKLAITGLFCLGTAISLSIFVISSFLFGAAPGVGIAIGTAAWFGWFWYGLPLIRKVGRG